MPRPRRFRFPLILAALALVLVLPRFATFYTDWLWFAQVGHEQVLLRSLTAEAVTGALTAVAVFAILWLNLRLAMRSLRPREFVIATAQGQQVISLNPSAIRPFVTLAILAVAGFLGLFGSSQWDTWLFYLYRTPFGQADPILGRDIGFYIFTLPLLEMLHGQLLGVLLLTTAGVAAAHVAGRNVSFDPVRGLFVATVARRHLALLTSAILLVLAFGAWLRIPQLLSTPGGVLFGASYTDVVARIPASWALAAAALAGAGLAAWQAATPRFWPIGTAVGLYLAVTLGGSAYATIIQRFVVAPNEQVRETPYIEHNIAATRAAFALDTVEERQLSGDAGLTRDDLQRNAGTIRNVPLWNAQPLLDTFGQIQEIRTYYDFVSVDNDRYTIDGQYRQIMLSARELNTQNLPSRTWINDRLTFTHGYGLTLGPVNEVTPEGLPVLFIKDLPPASSVDLKVTQPAIYYGELPNDHVFVKTATEEFDYPRGDANVFATYQGNGGVPISNFLRRIMFAIRFRSTDTFLSPNLTRESRVMLYRRIAERVGRIAPFLTYDPDPYLAISGGRLLWVQDAYTTSNRYPYASAAGGVNYIRNSIKVTIDAYHGTTTFHVIDTADPIAATIGKIFPGLLQPVEAMPEDLRTRLRYPQTIFQLQAQMFATFHMQNPASVLQPRGPVGDPGLRRRQRTVEPMEPYYTIMKLPGEAHEEYIQMLPYTPRQKDNLAAWIVSRSDGEHYGKLVVFQFPKQTVIFGPRQIAARINQDQVISPQITLWNQQGSEVIQGTLLVIPIEESLIYIRPLYLRSAGGRIPELKRVIVAYQNQIVMEDTLEQSLDRIFPGGPAQRRAADLLEAAAPGGEPAQPASGGAPGASGLAAEARDHYQRALQAQREGNWALYGEEIRKLGEVLDRLAREKK